MIEKTILCLANSRKSSGRCLAGKEILAGYPGNWIRPVSAREHQEISEYERQYENGSDPRVLDIINIPLLEANPQFYQQENWLIDSDYYWELTYKADWEYIQRFVDPVQLLWINNQSSVAGLNDRVNIAEAETLHSSLYLIKLERLILRVFCPGEAFGNPKRRVQGQFTLRGHQYYLWVTDPVYERLYLSQENGRYEIAECCLTISLGEPHEGFCYKLIAGIIEKRQYTRG